MVQVGDMIKITKIKQNKEGWKSEGVFEDFTYTVNEVDKFEEWFDFGKGITCYTINDTDFEYEIVRKSEAVSNNHKDKATKHKEICEQLNNIYISKNHDYGDSFSETYKKLGIISAVTRITDKVNRLQSLCTKEQKVKDESIEDTLMDLANYALMTLIELQENQKK